MPLKLVDIENFIACAKELNPSLSIEDATALAGIFIKAITTEKHVKLQVSIDYQTFATLHLR